LRPEQVLVGDARDLSGLSGQQFDGILALGPLYHLTTREERIAFLQSATAAAKAGRNLDRSVPERVGDRTDVAN
jgi:hypothetical protein